MHWDPIYDISLILASATGQNILLFNEVGIFFKKMSQLIKNIF
jgi:hypothetical protein